MKATRLIYFAALLLAAAVLCGCVSVVSDQPLSSPKESVRDARLEGAWTSTGTDSKGYDYISYEKGTKGRMLLVWPGDKGGISSQEYTFYATRGVSRNYLSAKSGVEVQNGKVKEGQPDTYNFVIYRMDWLGRLTYTFLNSDPFLNAVKTGRLKGRITYDKKGNPSEVHLTDSSRRILEFLESMPEKELMFGKNTDWTKLKKVGGL